MDSKNLRKDQLDALYESMEMIDEVLEHIDSRNYSHVVKKLHDARNKINAVTTGERSELGPAI